MYPINQLFTSGSWYTKKGKEKDFIRKWNSFAKWSMQKKLGSGTPYLLQDINNSRHFISFGPWPDLTTIQRWRTEKEFQVFVEKIKILCEKFDPCTLQVVAIGK